IQALELALLLLEELLLFGLGRSGVRVLVLLLLLEELFLKLGALLVDRRERLLPPRGRLGHRLAEALELGLVRLLLALVAEPIGEVFEILLRLIEILLLERLADGLREIALLQIERRLFERILELLGVGLFALQEIALDGLHLAERLGAIQPLLRDV